MGPEINEEDRCDDWIHYERPPSAEWLAQVGEELVNPRATSRGHKSTIYGCRALYDEVMRLRAEVERLGQAVAPRDTVPGMTTPRESVEPRDVQKIAAATLDNLDFLTGALPDLPCIMPAAAELRAFLARSVGPTTPPDPG